MRRLTIASKVHSGITDSAALCRSLSAPLKTTGAISSKIFVTPTGEATTATTEEKILHDIRKPAGTVHIVPEMNTTLISTGKFADANYITVINKDEVNIYNANNVSIKTM